MIQNPFNSKQRSVYIKLQARRQTLNRSGRNRRLSFTSTIFDMKFIMQQKQHPMLPYYYIFIVCIINLTVAKSSFTADEHSPSLRLDYYSSSCPSVFETIRKEMSCAVTSDPRNAAVIVRLHMHDCFVQGCDGSILLDDTVTLKGEKKSTQNIHSLKGFKLMDRIKYMVESDCPGVVSCADILAIAARDAIMLVGGPYWEVPVGRMDSRTTNYDLVETNIPSANDGLVTIISKFLHQGLSVTDMVALSGAHTIGMARCTNIHARIYGGDFETTSDKSPISETYLAKLRSTCPLTTGDNNNNNNNNVSAFDYITPALFDNLYYQILMRGEGLMNSDQEMYSSLGATMVGTRKLVEKYAVDIVGFYEQFAVSMVKMGNITGGNGGEVRKNCRFVNSLSHSE